MVERVNILDATLVMLSAFLSIFLGMGSYILFSLSATDIIFVVILGAVLSYPLFYIVKYIINNNSCEDIFQLNKKIAPIFGRVLNGILFIGMYILAIFILFNISDFINIEYLPESNPNFTKFLVLLPVLYILHKDLNSILKVNQIFCIIAVVLIIVDIIGVFQSFRLTNIEPLFTTSKENFIKAIICYIGLNGISLAMVALIGNGKMLHEGIHDKKKYLQNTLFKVFTFSNIIQFIIIISAILLLGIEFINIFRFPEYVSLKQFSLFNMLERIENILSLQFYFNSISILSYICFYIVKLLPNSKKIKIYPVFVLMTLYIITEILFKNTTHFVNYMEKYLILSGYILIIMPMIITFVILHKKVNKSI